MATADPGSGLRNGSRTHEPEHVGHTNADVAALLARLGDDVVRLVDGKLGLVKLDVEEQMRDYAGRLATRAVAAVVVAVGVTLAAAGLAFGVAALLPASLDPLLARAAAFASVGTVGVAAGLVVLRRGEGGHHA